MAKKEDYRKRLREDLEGLIGSLDLPELQKHFMRSRWLDQVLWMEGKAETARDWYYRLRLTTIVGGVIIPALVSLRFDGEVAAAVGWITFIISLLVAISAAVEEFFHYGERWRHYRESVELLKNEGWQFFQLSGPYRRFDSHPDAYRAFAARVEEINRLDVQTYVTEVVREKQDEKEREAGGAVASG
jgi:hypothetical protein